MDHQDERPGWVRLPGHEQQNPPPPGRADGIRRVRRTSNWTAAALLAGVAATTGYFAHYTPPAVSTATQTTQTPSAGQSPVTGHAPAAVPGHASRAAPVVTSGGSGVAVRPATAGAGTAGSTGGRTATITWRDN